MAEASALFDHLGARLWAEQAAAETTRLGVRSQASAELTRTEQLVAELAAVGFSNPEIGGRLSMSRKTVEFNLSKVYRKLRIRNRAQLSWAVAQKSREMPGSPERPLT